MVVYEEKLLIGQMRPASIIATSVLDSTTNVYLQDVRFLIWRHRCGARECDNTMPSCIREYILIIVKNSFLHSWIERSVRSSCSRLRKLCVYATAMLSSVHVKHIGALLNLRRTCTSSLSRRRGISLQNTLSDLAVGILGIDVWTLC